MKPKNLKLFLRDIMGKFSTNSGIQEILLNSTRRLNGERALSPRVIENLRSGLSILWYIWRKGEKGVGKLFRLGGVRLGLLTACISRSDNMGLITPITQVWLSSPRNQPWKMDEHGTQISQGSDIPARRCHGVFFDFPVAGPAAHAEKAVRLSLFQPRPFIHWFFLQALSWTGLWILMHWKPLACPGFRLNPVEIEQGLCTPC